MKVKLKRKDVEMIKAMVSNPMQDNEYKETSLFRGRVFESLRKALSKEKKESRESVIHWYSRSEKEITGESRSILISTTLGGIAEAEYTKGNNYVLQYRWSTRTPLTDILFWAEKKQQSLYLLIK